MLHKPHPTDIMDKGAVEDLVQKLKEMGEISNSLSIKNVEDKIYAEIKHALK